MLLSMMPRHDQSFGRFQRADGETFEVTGTIWESPPEYDYWLGFYEARHAKWGVIRMTLTVPKKIAGSIALALALQKGAPLEQVKSELLKAREDGKDLIWCPSTDGWSLVG
jgi:hypothetical protein